MMCEFSFYVAAVFILWGQAKHFYQYNQWSLYFNWTFTRHKYHVKKGSNHLQNGIHLELRLIIWYIEASIKFKRERGKGMSPIWSRLGAWDLTPGGYHSVGNGQWTWSLQVIPLLYSLFVVTIDPSSPISHKYGFE